VVGKSKVINTVLVVIINLAFVGTFLLIVMNYKNFGFWNVIIGVITLAVFYALWMKRGNLGFWQQVKKHPAEAIQFFATNPHWYIGVKPSDKDVVGPFKVLNPATGHFITVYCEADFIDSTQKELSRLLRGRAKNWGK
ncbi:MAG TPA: hypothetical protein VLV76_09945, partial [Candidatus Acidoferrum sp.]|nr:hypothetical protein [Candidatus Acidoferrum sp.]